MKTKIEIIAELKTQYPTLKSGSDETGYTDLNPTDYTATIELWADNQLAEDAKAAEAEVAKEASIAKLAALGLDISDLKALGF